MTRLALLGLLVVASGTPQRVHAQPAAGPPAATASPKVGDTLNLVPADWPKVSYSLGAPANNDAAGRVVVHWFCSPRVAACVDDLARIVTHRENGGVYIVAYVNGTARDVKKLDPIRESEGVGRGTVAYGPGVKKLFKQLGISKGPFSIVVGVDGKVQAVTTSADLNELDARDTLVKQLVAAVRPYVATTSAPPANAKPGDKLSFTLKIELSPWLTFSKKTPMELTISAAKEIACDARKLDGTQLRPEGRTLNATVTCSTPRGSYQIRGDLRFGYDSLNGATGLGSETASWKFDVAP